MAIAFARVQTHTRSKGHSATAAAAYRAGVRIEDERTGDIHDYTRRTGILHTEIVAPANAPAWAQDRERLWNAAEAAEKRVNSVVSRDQPLALPHELGLDEWRTVTRDFAAYVVGRHGVAVDIAIHAPDPAGDHRNYHAHFLFTTRRLSEHGFTEKTRELDDRKRGGTILQEWRQEWERLVNRELARAGHDVRIDMRSYADQGLDREGQKHLGPKWTEFERKTGEKSYLGQHNDGVRKRNRSREENEQRAKIIDLQIERAKRREGRGQQRQQDGPQRAANDNRPETFDRDAYHQQWQEQIDNTGIEHDRQRRQREKIERWANGIRARTQSRQHDELIELDRRHSRRSAVKEDELQQHYGVPRQTLEAQIQEIRARQDKGGFLYRVLGQARADRAALPALQKSGDDSRRRENEARTTYQNQQARERENLEQIHGLQRQTNERRFAQAFESGRIPDQQRRRSAERQHDPPQQGRTRGGEGRSRLEP